MVVTVHVLSAMGVTVNILSAKGVTVDVLLTHGSVTTMGRQYMNCHYHGLTVHELSLPLVNSARNVTSMGR